MPQSESNTSFFPINGGHPSALLLRPRDGEGAVAWRMWLKGGAAAVALSVALALCWAAGRQPVEATARMEQAAAKMERMRIIHPDLAGEIARLMSRPEYDCNRVACSAALQTRNGAARNRLTILMARKAPSEFTAGVGTQAHKFVGAGLTATGDIR